MALEIDGTGISNVYVDGVLMTEMYVDGTKVWETPPNIEFDTDLTGNIIFTVSGDGCNVDKGDGNYIYYSEGDIDIIPTGTVKLQFGANLNHIQFFTNNNTQEQRYNTFELYDLTKLTSMASMFRNCVSATINFNSPDSTINVESCANMFYICGFETIPSFNTSNVTDFYSMFDGNQNLTSTPYFDTSSGIQMGKMFRACPDLLCITNVDTTNATNTAEIFNFTDNLIAPNASQQTQIENGYSYVNGSPCP